MFIQTSDLFFGVAKYCDVNLIVLVQTPIPEDGLPQVTVAELPEEAVSTICTTKDVDKTYDHSHETTYVTFLIVIPGIYFQLE